MERYVGLDTHASSCTLAVVGPSGKRLGSHVMETNARALIEVIHQIPPNRHLVPGGGNAGRVALRGARAARAGTRGDRGRHEAAGSEERQG